MKCAFCPNPLDSSEEHIIPNGIGGVRSSIRIMCDDCNHQFGDGIDKALLDALEPFTLILDPPTRKQSIGTRKRLIDTNGDEYEMTAGGKLKVRYKKIGPNQWVADVSDATNATANTAAAANAIQARTGQRVTTSVNHGSSVPGPLTFKLKIDNITAVRSLMKWAIDLLVADVLNTDTTRPQIPMLERDFVRDAKGSPLAGYLERSYIPAMYEGLEHYVLLIQTPNGSIYWEASAYGGTIAAAGRTNPIKTRFDPIIYRVDPTTGKYSTDRFAALIADNACLWVPTYGATCLARTKVAAERLNYQMNLRQGRERIIEECLKEHLPAEGGVITAQHTAAIAKCVTEKFMALVSQLNAGGGQV